MDYNFQKKKTLISLDVVRVILAFFVVIIHASNPTNSYAEFLFNTSITRIAVPLFFMLSGYNFSIQKLSDFNYVKQYSKRQAKFFFPWIIVFAIVYIIALLTSGSTEFARLFSPLWFVIAIVACVFYMHILLKKLTPAKILILAAVLHVIGILADAYFVIIQNIPVLSGVIAFINTIFSNTRNGIFFGLFYVALGFYIKEKNIKITINKVMHIFLIILFIILQFAELMFLKSMQNIDYDLYVSLIPLSILVFTFLTRNQTALVPNFALRKFSMFIYVSHIMILMLIEKLFNVVNFYVLFTISFAIYMLIAFICFLISKHKRQ